MDELVKLVSEKTGLSEEMSETTVKLVLDYVKEKLPAPVAAQVDALLGAVVSRVASKELLMAGGKLNVLDLGPRGDLAEHKPPFFVKLGDGAADLKPIAHLYKTQVYQMAECLGVPEEIRKRPPTTDTYSMPQSQEEFYFSVPYDKMDICLYGKNHGVSPEAVAAAADMTAEQAERVYHDIDSKRKATRYLHTPPVLVDEIEDISC